VLFSKKEWITVFSEASIMDYDESLKYIKDCTKHGIKLGLERIAEILKRLGNPQQQFKAIHIAGTNGKGSTAAMYNAVLRQAGYRTGCYTSPHLISYRERFAVNQHPITPGQMAEVVTKIQPVLQSISRDGFGDPTEFEVLTVIAFEFFAQQEIEVAVIEVGMGGRFDATNVLHPLLSVITHIALDHQEFLGNTLEKIAFEKAGIIKPGVPLVIGLQEPEIEKFLTEIAVERGASPKTAGAIDYRNLIISENGTQFDIEDGYFGRLSISLGLIGAHQAANCLNVLAGVESLESAGLHIGKEALLKGLAQSSWPGRFQKIGLINPLKLYFDGAHNPDGAQALVKTIQALFPGKKVDLLFGILNNRPCDAVATILSEVTRRVIVTTVPDPKSTPVNELARSFQTLGIPVSIEPSPDKALDLLLDTDNQVAVATGSLYLIGYLRGLLYGTGEE
jgi:dihydrofolate synthase/folylpolyglutamate synthase